VRRERSEKGGSGGRGEVEGRVDERKGWERRR
jgi:hypothetical protein